MFATMQQSNDPQTWNYREQFNDLIGEPSRSAKTKALITKLQEIIVPKYELKQSYIDHNRFIYKMDNTEQVRNLVFIE